MSNSNINKQNSTPAKQEKTLPAVPKNEIVWEKISTTINQMALAKTGTIDNYSEVQKAVYIRNLVEKALKSHGYDYSRTLHSYANSQLNAVTGQYAILLVVSVQGNTSDEFVNSVYKGEERADVKKIIRKLNEIGMPL